MDAQRSVVETAGWKPARVSFGNHRIEANRRLGRYINARPVRAAPIPTNRWATCLAGFRTEPYTAPVPL
jgi:hypothetical protein